MQNVIGHSTRALALAAALSLVAPHAFAQTSKAAQEIVGTWQLVSDSNTQNGTTRKGYAFGDSPRGMIVFTGDGHYTSVNMRGDLPVMAANNRMQGTPEENKAIVQGSIAHFGTYKVSPDGKALMLTPQGSTYPVWVGMEQKRDLALDGDTLIYRVKASVGGESELVYRRLK